MGMVKLMVFLGNPTRHYEGTRHNVGWLYADYRFPGLSWREKFHGKIASGDSVLLLKPLTYMNESGRSVRAAVDFYGLTADEVLVVHDDVELEFGTLRLQKGGGMGGHKGLRSITSHLKSDSFLRLRIGVGRPLFGEVSSWVLKRFDAVEQARLTDLFALADRLLEGGSTTLPASASLG